MKSYAISFIFSVLFANGSLGADSTVFFSGVEADFLFPRQNNKKVERRFFNRNAAEIIDVDTVTIVFHCKSDKKNTSLQLLKEKIPGVKIRSDAHTKCLVFNHEHENAFESLNSTVYVELDAVYTFKFGDYANGVTLTKTGEKKVPKEAFQDIQLQ